MEYIERYIVCSAPSWMDGSQLSNINHNKYGRKNKFNITPKKRGFLLRQTFKTLAWTTQPCDLSGYRPGQQTCRVTPPF